MPDPSTPISDEAVEAAAKVLAKMDGDAWDPALWDYWLDRARFALTAAAPFMLADAEQELNAYAEALPEAHDRVDAAEAEVAELRADRDRYREAEYWLWAKGQRVCNGERGAVKELGAVLLRYSGPEWSEWNPYQEDDHAPA
jgi:hypothetical protein